MVKKLIVNEKEFLDDVGIADRFFTRFMGYMFRKKPHHKALLIKPCDSIHTFSMRFAIDVLFLDENCMVVKKYTGLPKNRIIKPVKAAKMVLESEAGGFDGIEVSDTLKFI